MHSRRKLRKYSEVAGAQKLQRMAAGQILAEAQQDQYRRALSESDARASAQKAFDDWTVCLSAGAIDLHLLAGLAARVGDRESALKQAELSHQHAQRQTSERRQAYAAYDIRAEQSDRLVARLRKDIIRKDEDNLLVAVEDRTSYAWSRS